MSRYKKEEKKNTNSLPGSVPYTSIRLPLSTERKALSIGRLVQLSARSKKSCCKYLRLPLHGMPQVVAHFHQLEPHHSLPFTD